MVWLIALAALAVTFADRQAVLPVWAVVVTWACILVGILLAAGRIALYFLKRRTRRAAVPVRAAHPTALDPPPITERTPA